MAEDNEINAIVAVEFLNEMGAEVDVQKTARLLSTNLHPIRKTITTLS